MANIESYMHDGANWQAQSVLAYLREYEPSIMSELEIDGTYPAKLCVGRYENTREQGYIFSVRYKCEQRNYCVYEHRNSDVLCVVVFDGYTLNTPDKQDVWKAMGDDKWNYTKGFEFGQIVECGDYIFNDMVTFLKQFKEG